MPQSWECCHFFWTMKQNHRNQQEKQPSFTTVFGHYSPINTHAASKQGHDFHSPCMKMISCTTLIIHSKILRDQNRFSCDNTRMGFCTLVRASCHKCATSMCSEGWVPQIQRSTKHSAQSRQQGTDAGSYLLWWLMLLMALPAPAPRRAR